jgi:hypothetical protein
MIFLIFQKIFKNHLGPLCFFAPIGSKIFLLKENCGKAKTSAAGKNFVEKCLFLS